jgi:hypothetical protein
MLNGRVAIKHHKSKLKMGTYFFEIGQMIFSIEEKQSYTPIQHFTDDEYYKYFKSLLYKASGYISYVI